jgi:hypothetical protein
MVRHVVLLRWRPDATPVQLQAVLDGLAELPAAIPEIVTYRYGPDLAINGGNADFGIVADFDSVSDYETYRDHPAHQAFIQHVLAPIRDDRWAVQFEH